MSSSGSKRWVGDKRFTHILLPDEHEEHAGFLVCVLYSLLFTHKPQKRHEKKKKPKPKPKPNKHEGPLIYSLKLRNLFWGSSGATVGIIQDRHSQNLKNTLKKSQKYSQKSVSFAAPLLVLAQTCYITYCNGAWQCKVSVLFLPTPRLKFCPFVVCA